jgi:hypothetical protein
MSNRSAIVLGLLILLSIVISVPWMLRGCQSMVADGRRISIERAERHLEIVVNGNHGTMKYDKVTQYGGMVCGEYTYPGDPPKLFAEDGSRLWLSGVDNMLAEPQIQCIAAMPRAKKN